MSNYCKSSSPEKFCICSRFVFDNSPQCTSHFQKYKLSAASVLRITTQMSPALRAVKRYFKPTRTPAVRTRRQLESPCFGTYRTTCRLSCPPKRKVLLPPQLSRRRSRGALRCRQPGEGLLHAAAELPATPHRGGHAGTRPAGPAAPPGRSRQRPAPGWPGRPGRGGQTSLLSYQRGTRPTTGGSSGSAADRRL